MHHAFMQVRCGTQNGYGHFVRVYYGHMIYTQANNRQYANGIIEAYAFSERPSAIRPPRAPWKGTATKGIIIGNHKSFNLGSLALF
jgi:hypothetical protein